MSAVAEPTIDAVRPTRAASVRMPGLRGIGIWTTRGALLAAFLLAWQLAADRGWIPVQFVGRPTDIWTNLVQLLQSGELRDQSMATLEAVMLALLIGVPIGVFVGLLLAALPSVDEVVGAYLIPLNSLPRIALAPLFILWFGLTLNAKVALAVSIIVFILIFNTRAGVKNVDPDLMTVARLSGLRRHQVFAKVVLPGSVPSIFAGVRLSITYALLGVIASEMIAARDGLGQTLVFFAGRLQVSGVFAVLLVLAVIATLLGWLSERLEGWLLRWQ